MSAVQAFIDEFAALREKVRLQEAEIAVLKSMPGRFEMNAVPQSEVRVFGRTLARLAADLDRLERFDRAANPAEDNKRGLHAA